jgi:hypothetical protein
MDQSDLGVIARETQSHESSELISAINYQLNIKNRATLSVSAVREYGRRQHARPVLPSGDSAWRTGE